MKTKYILTNVVLFCGALMLSLLDAAAQGAAVVGAGASATDQPTLFSSLISMAPMLAICYLIFWTMVIRPQDKKNKSHKTMVDTLKKGDSVVTTSGIVGRIVGIEKEYVLLEIATNVKIRLVPAYIARMESMDGKKAEAA